MSAYDTLTTNQKLSIEARLGNETKSAGVAYLLWFMFGTLAIHCFYLGQVKTGILRLIIGILGWFELFSGLGSALFGEGGNKQEGDDIIWGIILLAITCIWMLWDLFRMPSYIRSQQAKRREELAISLLPKPESNPDISEVKEKVEDDNEKNIA